MISWILVALVIVALIIFFKTTGVRFGKTWTFMIGILILFIVLTFAYVVLQVGEIDTFDGFVFAIKAYLSWLGSFFDNAATVGGEVSKVDWGANFTK
jgi:ABC-type multidrug transport system permease subunit